MNIILGFISLCSAKIVEGKCHLTPMNQAGAIKQRKTFPTGQRVFTKGAFTNYVYNICLFFDHLPPFVYIFYGIKVYKKSIFLTTYPPLLVNIVCERPLGSKSWLLTCSSNVTLSLPSYIGSVPDSETETWFRLQTNFN